MTITAPQPSSLHSVSLVPIHLEYCCGGLSQTASFWSWSSAVKALVTAGSSYYAVSKPPPVWPAKLSLPQSEKPALPQQQHLHSSQGCPVLSVEGSYCFQNPRGFRIYILRGASMYKYRVKWKKPGWRLLLEEKKNWRSSLAMVLTWFCGLCAGQQIKN